MRFGTQFDADTSMAGYQPEVTDYDLAGNLMQMRLAAGVVTDYQCRDA